VRREKGGSVRRRSIPRVFSIIHRTARFCSIQFDTGAVAHANLANGSAAIITRFTLGCGWVWASRSFTAAIIIGISMSAGQMSLHNPQEMHSGAKSPAFSSPCTSAVQGMPIGPG